ncbi:shikimate kinase [Caulobacter sp. Root1455]|uniref:shikimate kinase n=1 Tax=unclassified Caulobacter TaxID=2648921 RepID=UPI0006F2B9F9|nr:MULTISPECIES: shikimate kinase [unclassified Caulobacter]KQY29333.1 shikimate kinase [Caulobacter sp. Root487D2Y]KQY96080.1 shikimate kinase [Caulobacter sp. Root1455]
MTDDPAPSRPDVRAPESQGPDPRAALRRKTIVLVGLMGVGKSSVGRRLATALDLPFRDADNEVEAAAGRSIPEIFAEMGEAAFRDGERRVIARLLDEPPHVLATGGGAFVNAETRALIKSKAVAVWLKADLELLARRVSRKEGRPLLKGRDPMDVLREHAQLRYPAYGEAHLTVETGDTAHGVAVEAVIQALQKYLKSESELK